MTDWQHLRDHEFAVPEGLDVTDLVPQLIDLLASPDPTLRDETAFAGLATWVDTGVLPDDQLRPLGDRAVALLTSDPIQARAFAPLVLDVIVATRGVCEPAWVDAFEGWYPAERDVRGHDAQLGWLHAVAHGADLLGTLGLRPEVAPRRMLDLAAARMLAPTDSVWRDQEHDRLAYGIGRVLTRQDLTSEDISAWLEPVAAMLADGSPGAVPARVSNTLHTLRMLHLLVHRGIRLGPDTVVDVPHHDLVLDELAAALHPATPWMW